MEPNEPHFQVGVATALALQGKLSDAEALLRRQVARFPTAPFVWLNLGNVLRVAGRPGEAAEQFEIALRGEPGSLDMLTNLGSALAFSQTLPHGIYVAMNGRYFNWNNVRKNKETGIFEELAK